MRLQNPFSAVSPSGLDSQVLMVLARVHEYLSIDQIHRLLPEEGSRAGVRVSVLRFVEQGTAIERSHGRRSAYALNDEHLVARAVREIATSRARFFDQLADAVAAWPVAPLTVAVFGSAARDEMRSESDIDILVLMPDDVQGTDVEELVQQLAGSAHLWTGNDVRPVVYSASEVGPAPLFSAILDEGLLIAGDFAALRRRVRPPRSSA